MSDTNFQFIFRKSKKIDLIDEEWEKDCLSDDEMVIPKDFDLREIDEDDDNVESDEKAGNDELTDLGLEQLQESLANTPPAQTDNNEIPSTSNTFPS